VDFSSGPENSSKIKRIEKKEKKEEKKNRWFVSKTEKRSAPKFRRTPLDRKGMSKLFLSNYFNNIF